MIIFSDQPKRDYLLQRNSYEVGQVSSASQQQGHEGWRTPLRVQVCALQEKPFFPLGSSRALRLIIFIGESQGEIASSLRKASGIRNDMDMAAGNEKPE